MNIQDFFIISLLVFALTTVAFTVCLRIQIRKRDIQIFNLRNQLETTFEASISKDIKIGDKTYVARWFSWHDKFTETSTDDLRKNIEELLKRHNFGEPNFDEVRFRVNAKKDFGFWHMIIITDEEYQREMKDARYM